jgi:PPOX class probable F420-dependent enzyme
MPDGSPSVTPVWIGLEGDRILVGTSEGSLKARNLRRDPRLALSVVDFHDPYEEAQIRGRVVEFRDDSNLEMKDKISQRYTGAPFAMRDLPGSVTLVIEVEKARYTKLPLKHSPPKA